MRKQNNIVQLSSKRRINERHTQTSLSRTVLQDVTEKFSGMEANSPETKQKHRREQHREAAGQRWRHREKEQNTSKGLDGDSFRQNPAEFLEVRTSPWWKLTS